MRKNPKVYAARALVETYDDRHFGGPSGQYILKKDYGALLSFLPAPPATVLDIPCGTGVYSELLSAAGYQVVAVDASMAMLRKAQGRGQNLPCLAGDIFRLPFTQGAFDVVICVRLFQHYPGGDIVRMLRELAGALRPQGCVVFDTFRWTPRRIPFLQRFFHGEMYVYSQREVIGIVRAAGLQVARKHSLYLFSPIWQRKLPLWILHLLNAMEQAVPQPWLLRTFWACTQG